MNRYTLAAAAVGVVVAVIAFIRSASKSRINPDFVPQSVLDRIRVQNDSFDAGR